MSIKTFYVSAGLRREMTIYGQLTDITAHQPELAGFLPVFHKEKDAIEFGNGEDAICIKVVEAKDNEK